MRKEITPIGMMGWSPPAETGASWGGIAPVRWTVDLYHAAMEAGILYEGARIELVRGQIVQIAERPSPRYYHAVGQLTERLCDVFGERCTRTRGVLRVSDDTELEPEALVTRHSWRHYTTDYPVPEDALLVGEVAETTHGFLLGFKSLIYAQVRSVGVLDSRHCRA
ncbi:MAG: Uma2 family endonuclease [Fibrella sp.]|nr:Uma2 family endonuclease [Armatimonadota bacterium]